MKDVKDLKGTKTEANLLAAFAGESMARNKYTYFAARAKKDGYEQIAAIFEETAANEKEHAKLWFKHLHGGQVPAVADCLRQAAEGEHEEWSDMYKRMAQEAREEGFTALATQFEMVAQIEKEHEERYLKLLANLNEGKVFKRNENITWECRNCGHLANANEAPKVCPVCVHPQSFFEQRRVNY